MVLLRSVKTLTNGSGFTSRLLSNVDGGITRSYEPHLILISIVISILGSLGGIYIMKEYYRATTNKQRGVLLLAFAISLGGVGASGMHYTGLYAQKLWLVKNHTATEVVQEYDYLLTIISMVICIVMTFLGALIASKDPFFAKTAKANLDKMKTRLDLKGVMNQRSVIKVALLWNPWWLIGGSFWSALGAHFLIYLSIYSHAEAFVSIVLIPELVVLTFLLTFGGFGLTFWLIFRFLHWNPRKEDLRVLAGVLSGLVFAVTHYIAGISVKYVHSEEQVSQSDVWVVSAEVMYEDTLLISFLIMSISLLSLVNYIQYNTTGTDAQIRTLLKEISAAAILGDKDAAIKQVRQVLTNNREFISRFASSTASSTSNKPGQTNKTGGTRTNLHHSTPHVRSMVSANSISESV